MKIKRCPFCGSKADLLQQYDDKLGVYFLCVECTICGARSRTTIIKEEIVKAIGKKTDIVKKVVALWNNRTPIEVIKKWARNWTRPTYVEENGLLEWKSNSDDTKNFIMIGDLDCILDFIYDEEEVRHYYGELV